LTARGSFHALSLPKTYTFNFNLDTQKNTFFISKTTPDFFTNMWGKGR